MKPGRGFAHLRYAKTFYPRGPCKGLLFALFHVRFTETLWSEIILLFSCYRWRNQGLERLSNLPKDTQLKSDRGGIQQQWSILWPLNMKLQHWVHSPSLPLKNQVSESWWDFPKVDCGRTEAWTEVSWLPGQDLPAGPWDHSVWKAKGWAGISSNFENHKGYEESK